MFKKLQKHASEMLELPPDVLENGPRITMMGRQEIRVEYFKEVIHFSNAEISLLTDEGRLTLCGTDFVLASVLDTEITIKGRITSLRFEEA